MSGFELVGAVGVSAFVVAAGACDGEDSGVADTGAVGCGISAGRGGVSTVDLKIQAHGGPVPDANDAPPTVTVLLGDATAGQLGACGRFQFDGGRCVKRGKKLTCR